MSDAGADDKHVHGALMALKKAEAEALKIRRDLRLLTLRRNRIATVVVLFCVGYLIMNSHHDWMDVVLDGIMALVLFAQLSAAILLAPGRLQAGDAVVGPLNAALEAAGQHLQLLGGPNPYRTTTTDYWVGDDPTASERPWMELATIRRTAEAMRMRALPAAKEPPE